MLLLYEDFIAGSWCQYVTWQTTSLFTVNNEQGLRDAI